jgi:hypothetical protein
MTNPMLIVAPTLTLALLCAQGIAIHTWLAKLDEAQDNGTRQKRKFKAKVKSKAARWTMRHKMLENKAQ